MGERWILASLMDHVAAAQEYSTLKQAMRNEMEAQGGDLTTLNESVTTLNATRQQFDIFVGALTGALSEMGALEMPVQAAPAQEPPVAAGAIITESATLTEAAPLTESTPITENTPLTESVPLTESTAITDATELTETVAVTESTSITASEPVTP